MNVQRLYPQAHITDAQMREIEQRIKDGNFELIPVYNMLCEKRYKK